MIRFSLFGVAVMATLVGCGGEVASAPKAEEAAFKGTSGDDKAKVEAILKKEGIQGDVVSLFKGEKGYKVMVAQPGTPGKRSQVGPPASYLIDFATEKVVRDKM